MSSTEDAWPVVVRLPEHAAFYASVLDKKKASGNHKASDRHKATSLLVKVITRKIYMKNEKKPAPLRFLRSEFGAFVRDLIAKGTWKPEPEGVPAFIAGLATVGVLSFPMDYEDRFKYVYAGFGRLPNVSPVVGQPVLDDVAWEYKEGRGFDCRQLCVATFCLAAFVAPANGWHVARTFYYFKDFLADQVKVTDPNVPEGILAAAQGLMQWVCGLRPDDKLEACVSVSHNVGLDCTSIPSSGVTMSFLRVRTIRSDVSSQFYGVQPPTKSHGSRGVFQVNEPNMTLTFDRTQVTPSQMAMTLDKLPCMFDITEDDWHVVYDDRLVYLILTVALWKRIVYGIAPSMTLWDHCIGDAKCELKRKINYSVAPFIAHALCYGDMAAKLAACRGLVAYCMDDTILENCDATPWRIAMLPAILRNLDLDVLREPYEHTDCVDNKLKFDKADGCFYAGLASFSSPGKHKFMTRQAYNAMADIPDLADCMSSQGIDITFAQTDGYAAKLSSPVLENPRIMDDFYRFVMADDIDSEIAKNLFSGIQLESRQARNGLSMKKTRTAFSHDEEGENEWEKVVLSRRRNAPRRDVIGGLSTVRFCAEMERLSAVEPDDRANEGAYEGTNPETVLDDPGRPPNFLVDEEIPISLSFPAITSSLRSNSIDAHPDFEPCVRTSTAWTVRHHSDFVGDMDHYRWVDGAFVGHIEEPESDIRLDRTPVSGAMETFLHEKMDDRTQGTIPKFREIFSEAMHVAISSGELSQGKVVASVV